MAHIPTLPSDFLHLVLMLCRHLPGRQVEATIDYHLYGPAWTGGASDLAHHQAGGRALDAGDPRR